MITTGATGPTTGTTTGKTILALHPTRNNIMTIKWLNADQFSITSFTFSFYLKETPELPTTTAKQITLEKNEGKILYSIIYFHNLIVFKN